jgi:ribosome-binding factor A
MEGMGKNRFHDGPGPSQRQLRVGETIRRALSDILARGDVHDMDLNRLSITVGEVRTSPDLKIATAYVLPLGGQGQDEVIGLLARNKSELRRLVAKKLALKFAPDLRFQLDETFDRMDETREMLNRAEVRRDTQSAATGDRDPE